MDTPTQIATVGTLAVGAVSAAEFIPDVWGTVARMGVSGVAIWVLWNLYKQERQERINAQDAKNELDAEVRLQQHAQNERLVSALERITKEKE